jgi:hypothetical protein
MYRIDLHPSTGGDPYLDIGARFPIPSVRELSWPEVGGY